MRVIFILFLASLAFSYSALQTQTNLSLIWDIEKGRVAGFKGAEREYRLDRPSMQDDMDYCSQRERELLGQYKSTLRVASDFDSNQFKEYLKASNGYCIGFYKKSAPLLSFRFSSTISDEYELEKITIETLSYDPHESFSPAGFVDKEAKYEIILSHRLGKTNYDVGKRLRFSERGMIHLTFVSDDISSEGIMMTPKGLYHINITFTFNVKGKQESVSTGAFWMDV